MLVIGLIIASGDKRKDSFQLIRVFQLYAMHIPFFFFFFLSISLYQTQVVTSNELNSYGMLFSS